MTAACSRCGAVSIDGDGVPAERTGTEFIADYAMQQQDIQVIGRERIIPGKMEVWSGCQ